MSIQTNIIQDGKVLVNSGEALTSYPGRIVAGTDEGAKLEVLLPTAVDTFCHFIVDDGAALDSDSEVIPLVYGQELRLVAKGTITAGDVLVLADPATPADKGKVRTLPATAGRYFRAGIAEEDGVDGQYIKTRINPGYELVADTFTTATPAATAATNSSPYGGTADQINFLLASVREMRAQLIATGIMVDNA